MSSAGCPRCAAPRVEALDCPRCGVIYAKAEAHALAAVVDPPSWSGEEDDEALEVRVRILAIPLALTGAALLVWTGPGQFLVRTAESALRRGWLRWGFLVIGAVSFADAFAQWWGARSDYDRIPFGHNEGKGLSDPSVLTEVFGWTTGALVRRYVVLGCVCLASLAAAYVWGLWRRSERGRRQG